jgi:hypothetical protein
MPYFQKDKKLVPFQTKNRETDWGRRNSIGFSNEKESGATALVDAESVPELKSPGQQREGY